MNMVVVIVSFRFTRQSKADVTLQRRNWLNGSTFDILMQLTQRLGERFRRMFRSERVEVVATRRGVTSRVHSVLHPCRTIKWPGYLKLALNHEDNC